MPAGADCCHQYAQNVDRDDVGFAEARPIKGKPHRCGDRQAQQRDHGVSPGKADSGLPELSKGLFIERLAVRNDIHIQVRPLDQPVGQTFLPDPGVLPVIHAPHDDFRDTADPGVLRDLFRRVRTIDGGDLCAQLFRQAQVAPQAFDILSGQLLGLRCLDKERREAAVERLGHPGGRADHLGVGGG